MTHPNKDRLMEFFYQECSGPGLLSIREHIQSCPDCCDYLQQLKQTSEALNILDENIPPEDSFDHILRGIDAVPLKNLKRRQMISAMPYFQIALSIPFILAVLYFLHDKMIILPFWNTMENLWIIQKLGSYGLVAVVFFMLGSFVTLALAPVLLDSERLKKNNQTHEIIWR